jgi:hypothetical protein
MVELRISEATAVTISLAVMIELELPLGSTLHTQNQKDYLCFIRND